MNYQFIIKFIIFLFLMDKHFLQEEYKSDDSDSEFIPDDCKIFNLLLDNPKEENEASK